MLMEITIMNIKPRAFFASFKKNNNIIFDKNEELGINRKNIVIDNYCSGIIENLINGNLFTGFLILLKAEDVFIGIVTMIRLASNALQVFAPIAFKNIKNRKKFLIKSRGIVYLFNIVGIGIVPFLPFNSSSKLLIIVLFTLIAYGIAALTGPGYAVWHIKSIPLKVRNEYFSFLSVTLGIVTFIIMYLASKFIDIFKDNGYELAGFTILRLVAIGFCIFDMITLVKIKEYPIEESKIRPTLINVLVIPLKEKKYLKTIIISCLWSFAVNIPGPYYTIYLLRDLNVSYGYISLVNMIYLFALIFITPIWTKRIKRTSSLKTLRLLVGVFLFHYLGLAFVTEKTLYLYPLFVLLAYVCLSGINVVFTGLPFYNVPEENQTNFIGFYSTTNNIAAFLGLQFSSLFIKYSSRLSLSIIGIEMHNKQILMMITCVTLLCSLLIGNYIMSSYKKTN
jgi:Na+/melibiose symporter-like transporter